LEHTPFKRRRDALLKRVRVLLLLLLPVLLLRNLKKKKSVST